jgi:hypothetical protein
VEAQNGDTLHKSAEFLTNQLEDLAKSSDRQQDYSDLADEYIFLAGHPININSAEVDKLLHLHLLNEAQLASLKIYIHNNGIILSIYELQYISGFNAETIQAIKPFIKTGLPEKARPFSWKRAFKYGRHEVLMRYGQILEPVAGYKIPADSAFVKPGSVYLGTPQKLYLRYGFRSGNHLRWGFTTEKDAGEIFFSNHLSDSVKRILGSRTPHFPDFFSAFAYVSDMGILKKAVIGDYHLEFGQGLCLWSGLTFGKSAETNAVKYYGSGIRPNTSANENRFFRGAAFTLGMKNISLTAFYSHHKVDGSFFVSPTGKDEISTLLETGNHRTISELLNEKRLIIEAFGGHIDYAYRFMKVGATYYQTRLSLPLEPAQQLYRRFYFRGRQLSNASIDLNLQFSRISFFGELAANPGKSMAGIAGINVYPSDRMTLTLSYRNISPAYKVIYASPFMESGSVNNEKGLYFGVRILISRLFSFSAYADYFSFPWLKFQVNAPSTGKAFLAQLNMIPVKSLSMYFRIRYQERAENISLPNDYHPVLTEKSYADYRYAFSYTVIPQLVLKTRVEYVHFAKASDQEQGFLVYQDVLYRFVKFPLNLSFRYALFDTDGWNSRIYAYENDVLYAFTIPAYYDKGQRVYLLLHYRLKKHIDLWLKTSRTIFFNKTSISSGPDAIAGNHKTSIKVQVQLKF